MLNHQVIGTIIDLDALHYLNEQQGIDLITDGPPTIVVELPQDANITAHEMNHVKKAYIEELIEK